jgi:hypothetical protein
MLRFTSAIYPVGIPMAMKIFSQIRTGADSVKGQMFGHAGRIPLLAGLRLSVVS